ncbi:MAG: type II toxin-antitoxin system RelE/ParE family toxin [Planctomycetes bacterium]|nr:type II toxin-antitoxin system RelE/ParE family toxin [Planctomycetota bacterium]
MTFAIEWTERAKNVFDSQNEKTQKMIDKGINNIRTFPDYGEMLKGDFEGLRKLEKADWRIIYRIDRHNSKITIVALSRRKDAYK